VVYGPHARDLRYRNAAKERQLPQRAAQRKVERETDNELLLIIFITKKYIADNDIYTVQSKAGAEGFFPCLKLPSL